MLFYKIRVQKGVKVMKFSEFIYKRIDLEETKKKIQEITEKLKHAQSVEEQVQAVYEMNDVKKEIATADSLVYIRYTINTKDEFYAKEREYNDHIGPMLEEEMQKYNKVLLASPFRKELEEKLGKVLFINLELSMKGFSPEITELLQEESTLQTQYQSLLASAQIEFNGEKCNLSQLGAYMQSQDREVRKAAYEATGKFFDEHQGELDEIFDKLVKNRTEQAHRLGMKNFVELGYVRRQRNCYAPEAIADFRQQVVRDLVPIVCEIKKNQAERIGVGDLKIYDDSLQFPDGNAIPQGTYDEIMEAGRKMYTEMSPETADFIKMMFDRELFDVVAKPGKATGGYCADIPGYGCPFIFSNFNGTAGDVDVLTHEAGHAFAEYMAEKNIELIDMHLPSMEAAETHSMSMEFFATPWYELFFKHQTKKYEVSHLEGTLNFIPYGCLVDHFQQVVYEHPEMIPAERNEAWLKLEKMYRPYLDLEGMPFYGRGAGWQRQNHIYLTPFYYIDYCLAQTVALQFWLEIEKDWEQAWEKYKMFVQRGGTDTFLGLVAGVGLASPVEDGCIREIAGHASEWLKEHKL